MQVCRQCKLGYSLDDKHRHFSMRTNLWTWLISVLATLRILICSYMFVSFFFTKLFLSSITQSADSFQNLAKSRLWSFHEGWRTRNCFTNSHNGLASFPGHSFYLSLCFLHNYEIKSGSGLGTRLTRVIMKYEGTEIDHKDYAFTMCGKHNWPPSHAFFSRNRGRVSLVTSMVNIVQLVVVWNWWCLSDCRMITCTGNNILHTWQFRYSP